MTLVLLAAAAAALLLMIGVPVVAITLTVRRRHVPLRMAFVAAGFYLINLVVNVPLIAFVWPSVFGHNTWLTLLATCLTWAVCEELARYASFRWIPVMRRHRDGSGALIAGLGHGGAESILFALQLIAGLVFASMAGSALPTPTPLQVVMAGVDRLPAMAGHLAFAVLIVLAFRRSRRFLAVSIGVHFVVDFAVFAIQKAVPGYTFEIVFAVFAIGALVFVRQMLRRPELAPEAPTISAAPASATTVSTVADQPNPVQT